MATLRIYDKNNSALAVDLRHLLDLLAQRSLQVSWTISPVKLFYPTLNSFEENFEATGPGGEQLEVLAAGRSTVSGIILSGLANTTRQVIWGEFKAVVNPLEAAWVTIRAIDSTFYEVIATDPAVLDKVRSAFQDVRVADGPAISTPIPQAQRTLS
jgi:hypothetical protein